MQRNTKLSLAVLSAIILCVLATNLVLGTTPLKNIETEVCNDALTTDISSDLEKLKDLTPKTFEAAEAEIYPIRSRFIMWTRDGLHVMWGSYGNGRFVGTDNLRKHCWGIYGKGVFAGFYNGEFFWGKYCNGTWKAQYLFGLRHSLGSYVLFPGVAPIENST